MSQAEVHQLDIAVSLHDHVFRFQIAMDGAVFVGVAKSGAQLSSHRHDGLDFSRHLVVQRCA
jgi:hypothetical protein